MPQHRCGGHLLGKARSRIESVKARDDGWTVDTAAETAAYASMCRALMEIGAARSRCRLDARIP